MVSPYNIYDTHKISGESVMNKANRFCGWIDVDLSEEGEKQAR